MISRIVNGIGRRLPPRIRQPLSIARDRVAAALLPPAEYAHDGMRIAGRNTSFLSDPGFVAAYQLGMNSGHKILRPPGSDQDIHIEWRIHISCWAGWHARHLAGDFVECGVNTGMASLAVCEYVDFNSLDKRFFLFDTFRGIPEEQMSKSERPFRLQENSTFYEECFDVAVRNFARFPKAVLVQGIVPNTLSSVSIDRICYLHLDMNIAYPELAAIEYFWDKIVPGAPIILDDYGFTHYEEQKNAMDKFAVRRGVKIATLPTGQGFMLKP